MSYNILVTGGAGYLGSIFVPKLLEAGHKVTVLDNFMFRQTGLAHVCYHPNLSIVRGDVRIEANILPLLKQADIIFPLAALVGAPLCKQDPVGATTTNHDAIFMMLKNLSAEQRLIMPTTNSAYGTGNKDHYCDETSPLNPISQYAQEKVEVEQQLMTHQNAISLRLATVFGMSPRMRLDLLVNDFVYRAAYDRAVTLFESHFKRNYIHVRDVSAAFLHAIEHFDIMKGEIFNVGLSDANLSKLELCQVIQKYVPEFVYLEAQIGKDVDQRNYIVSNAKIEATGFKPAFSLDDGVVELLKGYRMIRNSVYGNV
ncbi:SDR family oxidoreductase [Candidatus Albibeggiatoa sp. nov. NOAA]|uniref:NAD-dependent epimerase/dehydratase family protein n=1 Tax=Candidatus Albibeggiatoa sp. nov. NOAA TaxID=3162724 RepID=UPI0032F147D0|nr:NAD-dependent epimerase/dehydratase family protein [Thiotrichaceae bacterium]